MVREDRAENCGADKTSPIHLRVVCATANSCEVSIRSVRKRKDMPKMIVCMMVWCVWKIPLRRLGAPTLCLRAGDLILALAA
jgi:hypothetical protein